MLILISSSGNSKNIINAAKISKKLKLNLITLSGFSKRNQLQNKGSVNFHVDSNNYNVIESVHLIILLQIIENLIKMPKKILRFFNKLSLSKNKNYQLIKNKRNRRKLIDSINIRLVTTY